MSDSTFLHVMIATSMQRTPWLLDRSLKSVYTQQNVMPENIAVIIVDDNQPGPSNFSDELAKIKTGVELLRSDFGLLPNQFTTFILSNTKTKGNSGTGAWNTGIDFAFQNSSDGFLAILDDDDKYLPNHLSDCLAKVEQNPNLKAVFQRLVWQNDDGSLLQQPLNDDQLTPQCFFIGNPGVQCSNMFIKTKLLVEIGGFDERLPNTTDRDLMIRLLWHLEKCEGGVFFRDSMKVIETVGVVHYNHKRGKVNEDIERKQVGLEIFYRKYKEHFSDEDFQKSLDRSRRFFKFQYPSNSHE